MYCHSGSRSAFAAQILRALGYDARNYVGSWHEWSRHDDLPIETLSCRRCGEERAAERRPSSCHAGELLVELALELVERSRQRRARR